MAITTVLDEVLHRFAPTYADGLTNHVPMAVIALDRLGAREDRIRAFVEEHASKLEPAGALPSAAALTERGVDAVVRERLARGMAGLAGAAFHGVIRLAYAMRSKHPQEIAVALAYLEESALVLPVAHVGKTTDLAVLVDTLRAAAIAMPTGRTITSRLEEVAANERFRAVVDELAVDKTTLGQVSGLGARWYLAADDFVSLHVLTGAHAVRELRPWTTDTASADRALAVAALAAFVACGSPQRADARNKDRAEDRELKQAAIESNDDHMAKLVVTAIEEEEAHEDAIYRIVATRAVRRGHT